MEGQAIGGWMISSKTNRNIFVLRNWRETKRRLIGNRGKMFSFEVGLNSTLKL